MKRLLDEAMARGAEATLVTTESKNTSVSFDANRLKTVGSTESLNLDMQVIRAGKLGVASSTKPGTEMELLESALDVAEFGSEVNYRFPEPEPPADPEVYSQEVADIDINRMISIGEELIEFIKTLDPAIQGSASVSKSVSRKSIRNTRGLDAHLDKTVFAVSAGFQFVEGQNLLHSWDWNASTKLDHNLEAMKATLKEDFDIGRKNVEVRPGVYDVLFTPGGFRDLIAPILACLNGRAVMRGISPFKDRIGEEIFAPAFSLVEDGTLDEGLQTTASMITWGLCAGDSLIEQCAAGTCWTLVCRGSGSPQDGFVAGTRSQQLVIPAKHRGRLKRDEAETVIDGPWGVGSNRIHGVLSRQHRWISRGGRERWAEVKDCMFS